MGYLTNFIVYTMAMVGIIGLALVVFKSATNISPKNGTKNLKVLDTLSLGPRKTLYIVSTGNEKFLIAGDVDRTTLISKLDSSIEIDSLTQDLPEMEQKSFQATMKSLPKRSSYMDRTSLGIRSTQTNPYNSVMKNLLHQINNEDFSSMGGYR